jgi:hypothetical protein
MANGRLGSSVPNSDTWTTLYTSPATKTAIITINVCNIGDFTSAFKIAITNTANTTPTATDMLEYNYALSPKAIVERVGVVLTSGQAIRVLVNNAVYAFQVYGFEQDN